MIKPVKADKTLSNQDHLPFRVIGIPGFLKK
jgi:hypothetical protein